MKISFRYRVFKIFEGMPFGRKIMLFFSFLSIVGVMTPWFFEKMISYSLLSHISFVGYSLLFFYILILYIGFCEFFKRIKAIGAIPNSYILFLLLFLALYTILIDIQFLSLLLSYSSDSVVRWGAMFTFITTGMSAVGLLISWNYTPPDNEKKEPISFVNPESIPLRPESSFPSYFES